MRHRADTLVNVSDTRLRALKALPRAVFDHVDGGAGDERTLRDNREAFEEVVLLSMAAAFPDASFLRSVVLGVEVSMPLLLAPCGGVRLLCPDGDRAVAGAAAAAGVPYVMSTATRTPLEEVYDSTPGPLWFQLYFHGSRDDAEALVMRVREKGFHALFVTVDSGGFSNLERNARHRESYPIKKSFGQALHYAPQFVSHPRWFSGFLLDGMPTTYSAMPEHHDIKDTSKIGASKIDSSLSHPCPNWSDIKWIREMWKGPLVVKGIMTPEDARKALEYGANGIVVSNHGGRQLDGVPGTLRVLRGIKQAVGRDLEIVIDGGIRRGTDVVKAVALGANATMIGRPYLYGLGANGANGVSRVIEIFRSDIERALGQLGCASIADLNEHSVDASRLVEFRRK